jgi:hypothetical protein
MIVRAFSVFVAASIALAAGSAAADTVTPVPRCSAPTDEWNAVRGGLAAGATCGSMIVSTDASDTRIYIGGLFRHVSLGRIARREPITAPYELEMDWQWLVPGRWTLEIHGLGIVVLLGIDTIGFYVDDAQMMGDMFEQIPTTIGTKRHRVTVRQTAREVVVLIDGKVVGRQALALSRTAGTLMIGIRGTPDARTRGAIRSFRVRPLTSP